MKKIQERLYVVWKAGDLIDRIGEKNANLSKQKYRNSVQNWRPHDTDQEAPCAVCVWTHLHSDHYTVANDSRNAHKNNTNLKSQKEKNIIDKRKIGDLIVM